MTSDTRTEDRELDLWREQWSGVARPSPEFRRRVERRIKLQNRRFWLGTLLTAAAFVGMLIFSVYLSHQASKLERAQATGVFVLAVVAVTCRLWLLRGTWRAETQSIRAFAELWHRRVLSQIRRLQIGIYLSIGWLVFCAVLAAANWASLWIEVMAHPASYLALTIVIMFMLPVIWLGAVWLRRRKVTELNEVTKFLEEMNTTND